MHDNYIVSYTINFESNILVMDTCDKEKNKKSRIKFCDVLTYSFQGILKYNQILDITERNINAFLSDNEDNLRIMKKYCWPVNYEDGQELKEYLIRNKYKYIIIYSSYGLSGWVLAKKFCVTEL